MWTQLSTTVALALLDSMPQQRTQAAHAQIVPRVLPGNIGETVHFHLRERVLLVQHAAQGIT